MARYLGIGGSERQVVETARALDRGRFQPHVAFFRAGGLREHDLVEAGVPAVCLGVNAMGSGSAVAGARRLAGYIREHNIRLVHTFDWPTTVFAAPVVRGFTRAAALSSQRSHRDLTPGVWRHALRLTDRLVDGIVVNCEFVRRHLIEDEKVPRQLIQVSHNGIDLRRFRAEPGGREPNGMVVIGTASALRPEKDVGTLISAFARILAVHRNVRLMVVGDGECLPALRAQAEREGVADECIFEPGTSDVPRRLRSMDIFVLPSLTEALSNSLMEAMACGCCAVASEAGGNVELIADSVTGALFRPGDAAGLARVLGRLVTDAHRRRMLAAAGESFIGERFSLKRSGLRMGEIYSAVINGR